MPWKSVLVAAALVLGGANMTAQMAFGRGMSGGAHFVGGGFAGHRPAISPGFVRPFRRNFAFRRRNFATGGWWPYDYDYGPTDAYDDMDIRLTLRQLASCQNQSALLSAIAAKVVKVPAEGGGTRQIKIIRCP
jgi:hypothetical protein